MKRKIATVLCTALSAVFLIAGCGGEKEAPQVTPSNEETQATVTPSEKPAEPDPEEESEAEDIEIQEEVPDEDTSSEADNSPFLFEIENPVIYDAEGVTITMDEWKSEEDYEDRMTWTFSVTNNNPDNKKVSFSVYSIYIDNFEVTSGEFSLDVSNLSVGETVTRGREWYVYDYFSFKEMIDTVSLPMESLSLYYTVQIGSDGEQVPGVAYFKNPELSKDDFVKVYGNKIDEVDISTSHSLEVYKKHIEKNGYTLITLKLVGDYDENNRFVVGWLDGCNIYINDKLTKSLKGAYGYGIYGFEGGLRNRYGDDSKIMCLVYDTPENIRKENEISNDVPLEGYISLIVRKYAIYYSDVWEFEDSGEPINIPVALE